MAVVAETKHKLVTDLAYCIEKGGAGFCARQGWTGGGGVWEWSSVVAPEVAVRAACAGQGQTRAHVRGTGLAHLLTACGDAAVRIGTLAGVSRWRPPSAVLASAAGVRRPPASAVLAASSFKNKYF